MIGSDHLAALCAPPAPLGMMLRYRRLSFELKAFPARPLRLLLLLSVFCALLLVLLLRRSGPQLPASVGLARLLYPHSEVTLRLRRALDADPENARAHVELGLALADHGFFMAALHELRAALRLGMQTAALHGALGRVYGLLARRSEAVEECTVALKLDPGSLPRHLELARALHHAGHSPAARRLLRELPSHLRLAPRGEERLLYWRALAAIHAELGDWDACLGAARTVLQLMPTDPAALEIKAQALLSRAHPASVVTLLRGTLGALDPQSGSGGERQAGGELPQLALARLHYLLGLALLESPGVERHEEALAHLRRAVELDPALGWAQYAAGRVQMEQKRWRQAADAFLQARAAGVETADLLGRAAKVHEQIGDAGGSLLLTGMCHESLGEEEQALAVFERLRSQPGYEEAAALQMARIHRKRRRYPQALSVLLELVKRRPSAVQAHHRMAEIYGDQEDFKKRAATLHTIAEADPANADYAYRELGAWYYHVQRHDEAERYFEQCIRLRPGIAAYHFAFARACIQQSGRKGKLEKAIQALERALTLEPNHAPAYRLLGVALQQGGRHAEAARALEHCIDLQPGMGDAYSPLIQAYRSTGRNREAQEIARLFRRYQQFRAEQAELERQVMTRPDDRRAKLELARFFMAASDYAKAAEQLKQAIRIQPGDRSAKETLAACYTQMGLPFEADLVWRAAARSRSAPRQGAVLR